MRKLGNLIAIFRIAVYFLSQIGTGFHSPGKARDMAHDQDNSPLLHSGGPWQYREEEYGGGYVYDLAGNIICDPHVGKNGIDTGVRIANGFLIEAAPDLLEGAEAAVKAFDKLIKLLPKDFVTKEGHRLCMAIEALREPVQIARKSPLCLAEPPE